MFHSLPARWLAALPAIAVCSALAQPAPAPAGAPVAAQQQKPLPLLSYRSAFENYQPYKQDKPVAWKEANDTVHQRGGWRAYAKEGAAETDAAPTPAKPSGERP